MAQRLRHRESLFASVIRDRVFWGAAVFALIGVSLLAIASWLVRLEWQYRTSARQIQGTVIKKWQSTSRGSSFGTTGMGGTGPTHSVSYMIRYHYRTLEGDDWEDEEGVGDRYWERLQPGGSLRVYYLPKSPHHSRLYMGVRVFEPAVLLVLGAMFTFMGVVIEFLIVGDLRKKHLRSKISSLTQPLHE